GKWIYGILIGFITVIVRVANPAYAEGVMLAILFMNVCAPLIDNYVVEAHIRKRSR
ncbi:MAG: NADH:ubiquinone reductase (Na(+)-transporting) subunit B, partial [Gammaproteobacteria bacterium]|nr:NADH:ubiquinone reductase (Na(+)-transporting) subunit B [Gammaproteobacteria bacterium]